jgi:Fibrinogen beta and gamma chains, C-terminal globular domain
MYRDEPLGNDYNGIFWEHWLGDYSLKATKMMLRPKDVWFTVPIDDDLVELNGNELDGQ